MYNTHHNRSHKQLILLGIISIIVLAGAGVLGGFVAGALSASRPSEQSTTSLSDAASSPTPGLTPTETLEPTLIQATSTPAVQPSPTEDTTLIIQPTPTIAEVASSSPISPPVSDLQWSEGPIVITYSIQGRPINAYRFGTGDSVRAIIGAIHGGYEWNTATMLTRTMDLLDANPDWVPSGVTLYVIPNMNPDGYAAGTDPVVARMNANLVDLNRNWDYQWQMTATHGTRPVKAGSSPFSEPETRGIRDFIVDNKMDAVIFYHSAMGVVFHGAETESSLTEQLTEVLSNATGYPIQTGIAGQITTGDAIDYLSQIGIAGTEIELTTHAEVDETEFQRNINGLKAFLSWASNATVSDLSETSVGSSDWITYVVQPGDMLSSLALKFNTTIDQLESMNGLSDGDTLYAGDEILVPPAEN